MTLTALLPTLRRSIPDPIALDYWPELSRATTCDVVVAGVSLLRVADLCGTPCAHSAAAVVPGTGGCPSPLLRATAIVARVVSIEHSATGVLRIALDARLDAVEAIVAETRLIGRASVAKVAAAVLVEHGREWPLIHGLPADVAEGELLAIPCRGTVTASQLRGAGTDAALPASQSASWLHALA